jgi:hypothetical protein
MTVADGSLSVTGPFGSRGLPLPRFFSRIIREPLLHFLLLGALIFALGDMRSAGDKQYRIVVDKARIAKLAQTYAQQFGGPPSPAMLRTLTDNSINEEILYREGMAMHLDQDDEVIRRRVVQKVQFLEQDLNPPAAPSDAALRSFYDSHSSLYTAAPRLTFTHIFFSSDKGGDAEARRRALAVLASLDGHVTRAPQRGDTYPDLYDYSSIGPEEAARLFGQTDMARAVFNAPAGKWSGPFRSGYGWHLVYVSATQPAHLMPFEQVRDQVRSDYQADAQVQANQRNFAELKARYTVVRQDGAAAR